MKVVIFGATGAVGKLVVNNCLKKGFNVTAFIRKDPTEHAHSNLKFYVGDVNNIADVKKAIQQQDLVICVLGDGKVGKIRAAGTKNIIQAMEASGVNGLICQTTLGMGDSYYNLNFVWKHIMFGWLLKNAFNDHKEQEDAILKSRLDYTIVRPSALVDKTVPEKYKVGFDKNFKNLTLKISKQEVADFITEQAQHPAYSKKAVSISH
ncbi:MAG: NAD(P)H-binding protein [Agriterribacter sp.]